MRNLSLLCVLFAFSAACIPGDGADQWDPFRGVWSPQSYDRTLGDDCSGEREDRMGELDGLVVAETLGRLNNAALWVGGNCDAADTCRDFATELRGGTPPDAFSVLSTVRHLDPIADGDVQLEGCEARPFPTVLVERAGDTLTMTEREYATITLEEPCTEDAVRERLAESCTSETVLRATLVEGF